MFLAGDRIYFSKYLRQSVIAENSKGCKPNTKFGFSSILSCVELFVDQVIRTVMGIT